ncbi:diguanylate cyclase [Actinoplanes sp. NBRC 101535]|uniref:diguanylate cyclase n=1 Tax=Actinoplanes sp. NBRC 101535 TaxID=3032196 RepID=UPI0024A1EBA9|nr:diguanylate cyclase [Actinoplanes sp. NBRC 101535]GLY07656.1 hypothetical protein Acsp01_80350 [Actinoplanes sp. NBRC 101535]
MGPDTPEDVLHDSDRTHVARVRAADGTWLVCKRPLGPRAGERLRNELAALRRLQGLPGVPVLAPGVDDGEGEAGVVAVVDSVGTPLGELPAPWPVGGLIELAHRLAGVLAGVHRRGVVHRDISPANILVGVDHLPVVIDFELAVLPAQDRSVPVPDEGMAGTLPYLAPEQTGRTGRPIDHRADLYALGATLYELATGAPPFGRDHDPLQLIHDHLARLPDAPHQVDPHLPKGLSEILMRLLHKEPDRRYQSAEGLAYDLALLHDRWERGNPDGFRLGARDFPIRLVPPARLIGRDPQIAALHGLLAEASAGHSVFALLTGPPGIGKTVLVERLRPAVAAVGGRMVSGKFDQFQKGHGGDAVREAFARLGAMLLAEPDDVVAGLRERLRAALGPESLRAIAAIQPSFRALLAAEEPDTEGVAEFVHVRAAGTAILRTVASAENPVVLFVDDLQWATSGALQFLDEMLGEDGIPGLLVLGAYRVEEIDETHPLSALRARLRRDRGNAAEVLLEPLGAEDLTTLVAEMLRLSRADAGPLAAVLAERTGGNPFDTVELLDALRREGELVPEGDGWTWDGASLRRFVGSGDVVDLLGARIAALPPRTREMVEVMACLGAEADRETVRIASGRDPLDLGPAVDDGLLVLHDDVARFRHDRVQEAASAGIDPGARAALHLTIARRLTGAAVPELSAAPHYLAGMSALAVHEEEKGAHEEEKGAHDEEKASVAGLFRRAAAAARRLANYAGAELYLAAALRLREKTDAEYAETTVDWHAALCALGRFDEADRLFEEIAATEPDPIRLANPAAEQISALLRRRMMDEVFTLGFGMLGRLGVDVPGRERMGPIGRAGLADFYQWLDAHDADAPLPELTDCRLLTASVVISRMALAALFVDPEITTWLVATAAGIWSGDGVCEPLVAALGHIGWVTIGGGGAYRDAYDAARHVMAVCEARGWEHGALHARFMHAIATGSWFEPLSRSVALAQSSREGMLRVGDPHNAFYTFYTSLTQMVDCADLDALEHEVTAALAMADRLGAARERLTFAVPGRFAQAMRTGTDQPPEGFDEEAHLAALAGDDMAVLIYLTIRGLSAAILGEDAVLAAHSARAVPLVSSAPGTSLTVTTHLLGVLGAQVRADEAGAAEDRDRCVGFLAARAADHPPNFRYLLRFAEAVRAETVGDPDGAAAAYDDAMAVSGDVGTAWQRPLIFERAARFYLRRGYQQVGLRLMAEAMDGYARWGATGKVRRLRREEPGLAEFSRAPGGRSVSSSHSVDLSVEDIDLIAVLDAARALSSETSLDRLQGRVRHVLSQLTGATTVHMILAVGEGWVLPALDDRAEMPVEEAAFQGLLPLSAVRYAERTGEPLLVDDAARDERVGRDPCLAGLEHCSLLVVPVFNHGRPAAMLVLENRLSRRAFSVSRLDAVRLIAGQLTVSLENARLYASLERKVAERTEELAEANHRLELMTVTDPLTGLANRRKLDAVLADEWVRSRRTGAPISVVMIDIDHFKRYNDHYGHQGGDECLRVVAEALRDSVRGTDLVARYGGEEFCVVMPGTTGDIALRAGGRLVRAVAELAVPHVLADAGIVTISAGVATDAAGFADEPERLTKLADAALYEAKRAGRNRVAPV